MVDCVRWEPERGGPIRGCARCHLALIVLAVLTAAPSAQELILRFDGRLTVHEDGWITVIETIRVRAEGRLVRHGITRDIPKNSLGLFSYGHAPFRIESVLRDGRPEPWRLVARPHSVRVRIGDPAVPLPEGEHTYTLTYRIGDQLLFGWGRDLLDWTVLGAEARLQVCEVSATLRPPAGVAPEALWHSVAQGSEQDLRGIRTRLNEAGEIQLHAPHGLPRACGLVLRAEWPAGQVRRPSLLRRVFHPAAPHVTGVFLLLAASAYFFVVWLLVRRARGPQPEAPVTEPPEELSPAMLGAMARLDCDPRCFAAAVAGLGAKGMLTIVWRGSTWTLARRRRDVTALHPDEKAFLSAVMGTQPSVDLVGEGKSLRRIGRGVLTLQRKVTKHLEKKYFLPNLATFFPGVALALLGVLIQAVIAASAASVARPSVQCVGTVLATPSLFLVGYPVAVALERAALGFRGRGWRAVRPLRQVWAWGLGTVILSAVLVALAGLAPFITLVALLPVFSVARRALRIPTAEGRHLLERIFAFRNYLLDSPFPKMFTPQESTEAHRFFSRLFPYAVALGVEREWTDGFVASFPDLGPELLPWLHSDPGEGTAAALAAGFGAELTAVFANRLLTSSHLSTWFGGGAAAGGVAGGGGGGGGGGGVGGW